jgi:hypothetical protein
MCFTRNDGGAGEVVTKIAELKKRLIENPEFVEEYEKADKEFALVEAFVKITAPARMSQALRPRGDNTK